jgi:hypothetical protein
MHRRRLVVLLPSLAMFLLWSVPAEAAGEPEIASSDLTVTLEGGDATKPHLEEDREYGPTTATVLVRNPTTKAAKVRFWAWSDDGQPIAITRVKGAGIDLVSSSRDGVSNLDNGGEFSLPAMSIVPVALTFEHLTKASSTRGHLALGGSSVSTVSAVGLNFERPTPPWYLWTPLVVGCLLAGGLVLARMSTLRERLSTSLPPEHSWTFKDGWASSIVVVSTVVIAVVGAVGSLRSEAFGDFSVADFVGLNLIFGSMVLVSPLTYSALRKEAPEGEQDNKTAIVGTVGGLMVAAAAVLWGAFGQLTALFMVNMAAPHGGREFALVALLLLLSAAFVGIYAWRTLGWTVNGYAELTPEAVSRTVPELHKPSAENVRTSRL